MAFSLRKGKAAVLKAVGLAILVLVVIVVGIIAWLIRSPLPKVNGAIQVSGISAPVTIRRDTRGIPHIDASVESDLFFGEGFACAQDRLWQIDMLRRTAEGKLSEIVGPATIRIDRYMRTLGLGAAAERDASMLRGQTRADLIAYAAGVNAAASARPLPLEYRLLGYQPQPWTPADSIAIVKLMAQRLDDQWEQVELRAMLQKKIGILAANALMDAQVPHLEHFIPGKSGSHPHVAQRSASLLGPALATPADRVPMPPDPQSGSNNWVVAGRLVTTGKPVLANDTHLGHSVPSTYWLVQLRGAGVDVEGFIIPGIPFVALGHNARVAFGVTSGDVAVQDLYVERFRSATSDEYLANGRWLKANHRIEVIKIKGAKTEKLDVLETRHGPVMKRTGTSGNALAWTILRAGNESELLRRLDLAKNWPQFQGALAQVVGPMFNWVYADVDGNIGYHLAGQVPNRMHGDGSLPVEGVDERYAWHGFLPFDALPHAYNPGSGILATANNQLEPATTPIGSSPFFDSPYRVNRIYSRLAHQDGMTPQAIGEIEADVYDLPRANLASLTARTLRDNPDARLRLIAQQLASWDGMATSNDTAMTFLMAEARALEEQLVAPRLGPALLQRYDNDFNPIVPLERVLRDNDRSLASIGITRASIVAAIPSACSMAADAVGATKSAGLQKIKTWGPMNMAIFDHPLGRAWPLTALFNIKSFAQPGDGYTVYAAKPDHGPASRLVNDLANWDNSSMLLTLGESGQFNDPHYQDEAEDFLAVKWVTTPFSDAAVRAATKDTLTLNP